VRDDIALVCDGAHESRFLFCYISRELQVRNLISAGFAADVLVVSNDGRDAEADSRDTWLYYRAVKPAA
jgi:hypothetical protein